MTMKPVCGSSSAQAEADVHANALNTMHTIHDREDSCLRDQHAPTIRAYGELILAYRHFNVDLFLPRLGQLLPDCMLTLQRRSMRTMGYFHGDRFGHNWMQGQTTDEIAMNPRFFGNREIKDTLSTLVHEMVHLYIYKFVERRRSSYHSRAWANAMLKVGLHPTTDGTLTGRQTGQRVSHLIVAGGPFDVSADQLLTEDFRITWRDRLREIIAEDRGGRIGTPGTDLTVLGGPPPSPLSGKRVKFSCPQCRVNAWGKTTLNLVCGDCRSRMIRS